jgi:arylsulfatase A-like enzyme
MAQQPNVVFILADDQGYGDIALNGNRWIHTPNMDQLGRDGIQFSNFHTGTTCSPTRAGLMTGMYCNKVGVWHTVKGRSILSGKATTVAELFRSAGYSTGIFGKWHLGDNYPYRPQDRGFQETLVCRGGGVGQSPDYWNNDYFEDSYFLNGKPKKFDRYCNEVWFDNAISFIENAHRHNRPFFCYIPTNLAHEPYHVPQQYIDRYSDNDSIPFPAFYGMISNIDEQLGRLRKKLTELGIADNTIIIYSSDNGTSGGVKQLADKRTVGFNTGMRGKKGSPYEGGHREPLFIYWKNGKLTGGKIISALTGYIDIVPTLLDLCKIDRPGTLRFDGKSLLPLFNDDTREFDGRILFTDTQREEYMLNCKNACIMMDNWRLLDVKNKKELYDLNEDPGQSHNIIAQHQDIAAQLGLAYEKYWDSVTTHAEEYIRIAVGAPAAPPVTILSSMDCHMETGMPAWNQVMVRNGVQENGFWALEVESPGRYRFELRRYPAESRLALNAAAPPGDKVPGGVQYPEGKVLHIKKAFIEIGGQSREHDARNEDVYAAFTMELQKGPSTLSAGFIDGDGKRFDAYYVYVKKIP